MSGVTKTATHRSPPEGLGGLGGGGAEGDPGGGGRNGLIITSH